MSELAVSPPRFRARLLGLVESIAALFLAVDLLIVLGSVSSRFFLGISLVWADDAARALMLALSFLGAAAAMAKDEQLGITFFVDRLSSRTRSLVGACADAVSVLVTSALAYYSFILLKSSAGITVGSGWPQWTFFAPMFCAALAMIYFCACRFLTRARYEMLVAAAIVLFLVGGWTLGGSILGEPILNAPVALAVGFVLTLMMGVPIGVVLAFTALIYVWGGDFLPGEIFAQQMARGIDNFVLLAVPFFILVGYLMEANGMSVRLIALLQRGVGKLRGGLNIVMIASMVIFSGISGSKIADVAAVGSVLVPAARRAKQDPADAVALLAASAIMGETIPPCINLIILGFVANVSIGGLFAAGLLPAALMALALIAFAIVFGKRVEFDVALTEASRASLLRSGLIIFGLIAVVFGSYRTGFATATEASAFAALYALVTGTTAIRELSWSKCVKVFKESAARAGTIMFIIAAAQSFAYTLTLEQLPHALAELMTSLAQTHGAWLFMLVSIVILVVMGAVLEGAAALIIFGPLLMPVAHQLGIDPLHYGIVLVIGMGVGLFAPPLGLGLYSACLIGNIRMEQAVRPILKYLGVLFACFLLIAYVPWISTAMPRMMGY